MEMKGIAPWKLFGNLDYIKVQARAQQLCSELPCVKSLAFSDNLNAAQLFAFVLALAVCITKLHVKFRQQRCVLSDLCCFNHVQKLLHRSHDCQERARLVAAAHYLLLLWVS